MCSSDLLAAARRGRDESVDRLGDDGADKSGRTAIARFFAENLAAQAPSLARIVTESAESVLAADAAIGAA